MKLILTVLAAILITATIWAQSPEKMSYQAVIRNSSDALVTGIQIGMQISILQGSASGTAVYVETHTPETNENGLVSIEIGGGTVVEGTFSAINWANGTYFIKTETDPTGGSSYTITGTSQFLSVPYALHSKTAEAVTGTIPEIDPVFSAWDKNYNDLTNRPTLFRGSYDDLSNKPVNIDEDKTDDVTLTRNQTISGNKTFTGVTTVASPVNPQDAATKAYVDALSARIKVLEELDVLNNGLTDLRDGTHYEAVKIGNQIWMKENLKYLPSVVGSAPGSQIIPYYYVIGYNGTNVTDAKATSNYTTYGVLYNWSSAMNGAVSSTANPSGVQGVCPVGWHLPSDAEWTQLSEYLGGENLAAGLLKEAGTTHWNTPNTGATNESGFTALPGGNRGGDGAFGSTGIYGGWWSATEINNSIAQSRIMYNIFSAVSKENYEKLNGFSIRCVRD